MRALIRTAVLISTATTPLTSLWAAGIGPIVVAQDVQLAPSDQPQSGRCDVWLSVANGGAFDVAGYQVQLTLSGPDGAVKLIGASAPLGSAYLFAPDSAAPFFSLSADGYQITIGDFLDAGVGRIVDGVGLASLHFTAEQMAAGNSYDVLISVDPTESFFGVDSTTFLPFTVDHGSISVVPESGSWVLSLIGGGAMWLSRGMILAHPRHKRRCGEAPCR